MNETKWPFKYSQMNFTFFKCCLLSCVQWFELDYVNKIVKRDRETKAIEQLFIDLRCPLGSEMLRGTNSITHDTLNHQTCTEPLHDRAFTDSTPFQ